MEVGGIVAPAQQMNGGAQAMLPDKLRDMRALRPIPGHQGRGIPVAPPGAQVRECSAHYVVSVHALDWTAAGMMLPSTVLLI